MENTARESNNFSASKEISLTIWTQEGQGNGGMEEIT